MDQVVGKGGRKRKGASQLSKINVVKRKKVHINYERTREKIGNVESVPFFHLSNCDLEVGNAS